MIDFIKGNIDSKGLNYIVLENNSKGYLINMSDIEVRELELQENVKILTRLIVREDSITLYGFINNDSRDLFDLLTTVSSIGPKIAMGIISSISISKIINAINNSDVDTLTKAQGIGKKTAQRIILELKDKLDKYDFNIDENEDLILDKDDSQDPAVEALITLGYNKYEANLALKGIDKNQDISKIIKEALKNLGR
ncbi:MAG: Holliday junction branch migration protein RuvA [Peptoniphilaceae bacterium]